MSKSGNRNQNHTRTPQGIQVPKRATNVEQIFANLEGTTILDRFQSLQKFRGKRVSDDDVVNFLYVENARVMYKVTEDDGPAFRQTRDECIALHQYLSRFYLPVSPELVARIEHEWPEQPLVFRLATVYRNSPMSDGLWWNTHQECKNLIDECLQPLLRHVLFLWEGTEEDATVIEIPKVVPRNRMQPLRRRLYRSVMGIARNGGSVARITYTGRRNECLAKGYDFNGGKFRLWTSEELQDWASQKN